MHKGVIQGFHLNSPVRAPFFRALYLLRYFVYFLVQVEVLMAGERLYVDLCYVTSSKDPNPMPRVDIRDYGWVCCLQELSYTFLTVVGSPHRQQNRRQTLPVPVRWAQCAQVLCGCLSLQRSFTNKMKTCVCVRVCPRRTPED